MAIINQGGRTYDTNNQSDRADLRKAGDYIDDSGVYSGGGGQRVGDTWSGANANKNVAPNNVFLPIKNGMPQSPWKAQTASPSEMAAQPGAVPFSSPDFASLFGPGSYFFQTGGPSNYQWMQPGAGAQNPNDFMSAIQNYLNMAANTNTPSNAIAPSSPVAQSNVQSNLGPANPYRVPGGAMDQTNYALILRQMYPGVYGTGSLNTPNG